MPVRSGHAVRTRTGLLAVMMAIGATSWMAGTAGPAGAAPPPAATCTAGTCTIAFTETGSAQTWTVPTDITTIVVTVAGGSGGAAAGSPAGGAPGAGGQVTATIVVNAGEDLAIVVGAQGAAGVPNSSPAAGGYGGGGDAGNNRAPVAHPGGAGGGGSFVFDISNPVLLVAAGGGGGAGGGNAQGNGGGGGPGGDATAPVTSSPRTGGGATTSGPGSAPPDIATGNPGAGPAATDTAFGVGGAGADDSLFGFPGQASAGGGGGGYYGGAGGSSDPIGFIPGGGGGGSGFLTAATGVSTTTHTGDGAVSITYSLPTTTSGFLRDAATGAAIANSCVVFSPVASPGQTNYDSVNGDGSWSFTTDEAGPFNLAFYTTSNGDCSQPIQSTPVPSWYVNQPLTGTDEHTITPPAGATAVAGGTSGVIACLGATALPSAACAIPNGVLSGTVDTTGPAPLADVCVIMLDSKSNGVGVAVSDSSGHWSITGLPSTFSVIVVFLPGASDPGSPCAGGNGPPPVPAAGALQPIFYNNIWINLADPVLLNNPYAWAVAHGATLVTASTTHLDTCITTADGTITPRPSCTPAAQAATTAEAIANTGTPTAALLIGGTTVTLLGVLLLHLGTRRRATPCG
jgi:Glycine rich protein